LYRLIVPLGDPGQTCEKKANRRMLMTRFSDSVSFNAVLHAPVLAPSGDSAAAEKTDLGKLPEWNLADLYAAPDSPQLKADIEQAMKDSVSFEERWKGKLGAEAAKADGGDFADAIKQFEALDELLGRIASYAGLYYYGDTTDPKRMKLFGDVQQKLKSRSPASAHGTACSTRPCRACVSRSTVRNWQSSRH